MGLNEAQILFHTYETQRCIPNMKKIHSKLWSVYIVSGNQTVSGGGGSGQNQNQSIPNFVWGYNKNAVL
jgi:hypothetical protein